MSRLDQLGERTWDVLVIGAGLAGAMTARQAARGGASVLLADRRPFPRPKVCGACLNGRGLAALESVGLGELTRRLGAVSFDAMTLGYRSRSADLRLPPGVAISRHALDDALVKEAIASGVVFADDTRAVSQSLGNSLRHVELEHDGRRMSARARIVVVAAGLAPQVLATQDAIKVTEARGSRCGAGCVVAHAPSEYLPGRLYMAVGRGGYVGLVRVEDGRLNVAAAFDRGWLRQRSSPASAAAHVLAEAGFPAAGDLADASWIGTVGLTRKPSRVFGERLFLVGDSAGYVEPFTGEGMSWALSGAEALASIVLMGVEKWNENLGFLWDETHRRMIRRRQYLCHGVAALLRRPLLSRLAFEAISRRPGLVNPLVQRVSLPNSSRLPGTP